jgi:hypothetical protein
MCRLADTEGVMVLCMIFAREDYRPRVRSNDR